jgi:branched-chain amino acid transport system ATP-binding protein
VSGLEVRGLHAYYGESHVLQGVDIDVRDGEAVALVGRNGAGKTTTIAAIMGSIRPRAGRVRVGTSEVAGQPAHRVARAGVALVPQGRRIFAELSVRENLLIAARPVTGGWDERRVLELFPALGRRLGNRGDELSGGEQQMLAIARALMTRPRLLMLDEPSLGLAPVVTREVFAAIGVLRTEWRLSVLVVEQNAALALELADTAVVLESGRVVLTGPAGELAGRTDIRRAYLGA